MKMKQQALAEFEAYKHRVEDMQLCAEAQHVQRIVTMSREVEEIRRKFEERLRSFGQLQVQFEKDKRLALEDLRTAHRQEIQELLKSQQDHSASVHKGQTAGDLQGVEAETLNKTLEELKLEQKRLIEDYEGKLNKAQSFYEHELDTLKRSQLFTAESLQASKEKEAELRKEFQAQEAVLRKTIGKLRTELQMVQDEAGSLRDKCQKLQKALVTAENSVQGLQKQLDDAKQGEMALLSKHKEVESELAAARERLQQQASDLVLKASHIGMLQATQMNQEVTIKDLESEKSRTSERLSQLEEERSFLQSKTLSLDEEQKQQILELEKKVNEANKTQQEYYELELKNLQNRLEGEVAQLNEAHSKTLEELAWKHHMAIEAVHSNASREKQKLQMELEEQYEKEKLYLEEDKSQLQQELENLKKELEDKLKTANQEVGRLRDLVRKSEQGLGSAEGLIASLQDSQGRLQDELDLTKRRLQEAKDALLKVESERDRERQQHEETLAALKGEETLRVDKMAQDLEIKWTENLRQECSKLREELRLQHEEDKKSAMSQLFQLKEREKNAARDSWQKKVEDLLNQISLLKQNLELQLSQSQTSLQQLQAQFTQERQRLTQELEELEEQHQQRHKSLKEAHVLAFQTMEEEKEKEQRALESHLQQKHSAELQSLKDAHRESMEGFRVEMEQELQTLRFELEDEGKAMLASLRSELNHQHAAAIDLLWHNHHQELAAAKMELERSIDISRRQSKEQMCRITDLQDELRHREHHISDLDKEVQHLHENISALTKELEFKGKEILRIRSESNQQMRLEEMEEKYLMRESKPEDVQMITELKTMLTERDHVIKKLIQKKKNDKSPTNRFVSVPNLSALESGGVGNGHPNRLDPIPNSPVHDTEFNSNKPLPQPVPPKEPKTFLSPPQSEASPVASPDPQRQEWFARYFTF
ncbi:PREDICTED: protein FAM184A isoform X7 [Myotis davidii]|uniref:protein FAM184A isoform X7 n=1 Tax=Myotis davidii TaxID=225400 RepID=UPI0003EBE194|nr:PREDICTED: protein FAM184A isoform X7 [Myotis davidii]